MNNSVILTFYFFFSTGTVHTIGLVRSQCNDALVRTPPAEWCERSDESGYRKEASCTLPLVLVGTGDVGGGDRVRARAMRMCEADRPEQQAPRQPQPQPRPVERQDHRSSIIQPTTSNRSLRLRIEPPCLIICFFFLQFFHHEECSETMVIGGEPPAAASALPAWSLRLPCRHYCCRLPLPQYSARARSAWRDPQIPEKILCSANHMYILKTW